MLKHQITEDGPWTMSMCLRGPDKIVRIHADLKRKPQADVHVSEPAAEQPSLKRQKACVWEDNELNHLNQADVVQETQVQSEEPQVSSNVEQCPDDDFPQTLALDVDSVPPEFDSYWRQQVWDEAQSGQRANDKWAVLATLPKANPPHPGASCTGIVDV